MSTAFMFPRDALILNVSCFLESEATNMAKKQLKSIFECCWRQNARLHLP